MEYDIKKEHFANENFDPKKFINSLLVSDSESEYEIISFKLKILQREFSNELELNTNNLLKFCKVFENDLIQTNTSNNLLLKNIVQIAKNKIDHKQLEEFEKAIKLKNKNNNLGIALSHLEKN